MTMNDAYIDPVLLNELKKKIKVDELEAQVELFLKTVKNPIKLFSEWRVAINEFLGIVERVVVTIEAMQVEFSKMLAGGKEKMKLAAQFMDELIRFPFFLELVDDKIFYIVISLIVGMKNKVEGHKWNIK